MVFGHVLNAQNNSQQNKSTNIKLSKSLIQRKAKEKLSDKVKWIVVEHLGYYFVQIEETGYVICLTHEKISADRLAKALNLENMEFELKSILELYDERREFYGNKEREVLIDEVAKVVWNKK